MYLYICIIIGIIAIAGLILAYWLLRKKPIVMCLVACVIVIVGGLSVYIVSKEYIEINTEQAKNAIEQSYKTE